jgi:hypothetical protein
MKNIEANLLNLIIQQMTILNLHESNIIQKEDLEKAILTNSFLQNIVLDWNLNLIPNEQIQDRIKKLVNLYPKYTFTSSALKYLQYFFELWKDQFPNKQTLVDIFPLYVTEIDKLYESLQRSTSKEKLVLKPVKMNLNSNLYHTTNSFIIFERKGSGTPLGPASFNIDSRYPFELISEIFPNRGSMRVIRYRWLASPWFTEDRMLKSYPFLDSDSLVKLPEPRILDARKITHFPKHILEDYIEQKGVALIFPEPDLSLELLDQYGRNWRPFIIDYLKYHHFDGILFKDDQIMIFEPQQWISFDGIEEADSMYVAVLDVLEQSKINPQYLISNVASRLNVDPISLEIIYKINLKNQ